MCGIFGAVFVPEGRVDVDRALARLHHRGPDHQGSWRDDRAVLGHARLSILDLSPGAHQPMVSAHGDVVVAFNGEIYNHHALRRELEGRGHEFRTRSDTEVIVEGYRAWGDEVVRRIDGMFAIAVWDTRRHRLLLARDRAGKKPLFYAVDGEGVRFASEAKALFASGLPAAVDPSGLPSLLTLGYVEPPGTLYRGVEQLPPASMLVLERGERPLVTRYWHAPFAEPPIDRPLPDTLHDVRRAVERAVERRLEADVPLGAFLSGGVDSTIIVGVMRQVLGAKVRTFSIGFSGDARYDETRYARIAAEAFETEHTEFTLEPSSFELVERLVAVHDGPFGDSSAIPTSVVSRLTREHVTVALTGDGGDELFCGYPRFLAAEAADRIPQRVRDVGLALVQRLPRGESERTLFARGARFFRHAARPLAERLLGYYPYFAFELDGVLRRDVARAIDVDRPLAWTREILAASAGATPLARVLHHNFESYLPHDLLVKADRSSMLHSLEVRSPFLDTELVALAARLRDPLKRRGPRMKWVLKKAFDDLIPGPIKHRKKMGFGVPLAAWFRGDLRDYLLDHLGDRARLFDYLERDSVRRLVDEHMAGKADHGQRIWLLLTLEIWLRGVAAGREGLVS
ncbi:MAG: asparagine synthase (glutamine-hydrolyzing) [Myxococcales bacterium]|jgi:asparagine synthase (glutamine-hydrolysing)|nr:asparagine synthase (glutamine-hydrolyzing) [Myxococcales bacterium]